MCHVPRRVAREPLAAPTMAAHVLLPAALLTHRYQLCNFSCADGAEQWLACRSEKCTPRLPEDYCSDGTEANLVGSSTEEAGIQVSGPQECAEVYDVPRAGSFSERCDLCMALVGELTMLWHEADTQQAQLEDSSSRACAEAAARTEALPPTVRTCRYQPSACDAVLATAREQACPKLWDLRRAGETERAVRARQREVCGALMTQRNGSGVDDALICPHPRDVGARIMAIAAVIATVLLAAQTRLGVYAGVGDTATAS